MRNHSKIVCFDSDVPIFAGVSRLRGVDILQWFKVTGYALHAIVYVDHAVARFYDLQGNMLRMKVLDGTADTIDISRLFVGVYLLPINGITIKVIKKKF